MEFDCYWIRKLNLKYASNKIFIIIMKALSFFGREPIWLFLIDFYILVYVKFENFLAFGNALFLGLIIVNTIKKFTNRKRPYEELKEVKPLEQKYKSSGFPSWHTFNASVMACIIGYLCNSIGLAVIFLGLGVLVGISRIVLGMHYPSDVIIGYLLGFVGFLLAQLLIPAWLFVINYLNTLGPVALINDHYNIFLGEGWFIAIVLGTFFGLTIDGLYPFLRKPKKDKSTTKQNK
ncbi:MAG: phosphatase PAP2 family protein [Promethearchaeota archaeon]